MEMAMAIVRREETRKRRMGRPHPLAGRTGTGAPIAPPGWRWRAGRRVSDMCFYSPDGKAFRSQINLQKHLAETPGTPPLSQFRFNIAADDFKDTTMPGEPLPLTEMPRSKCRLEDTDVFTSKRVKLITQAEFEPKKNLVHSFNENAKVEDFSKALTVQSSMTSTEYTSVEGPNFLSSNLCPNRFKSGGMYKYKKGYSFTRILASQTSYVVLWKNENILQKFLNDATRLKEKSDDELEELRTHLLHRKLDSLNLSKYPVEVLRAFFFLLRNQEAPSSFGKEELLELCSNWSCKKKHYWCFSERHCFHGLVNNSYQMFEVRTGSENQGAIVTTSGDMVVEIEKAKTRERTSLAVKAEPTDAEIPLRLRSPSNETTNEYKAEPTDAEIPLHLRSPSNETTNEYIEPKEADKDSAIEEHFEDITEATYTTLFGAEHPTFIQEDRCSSAADALQCALSLTNTQFQKNDISFECRDKPSQVVDDEGAVHRSVSESMNETEVINHVKVPRDDLQPDSKNCFEITKENFIPTTVEQGLKVPAVLAEHEGLAHPFGYCESSVLQQVLEIKHEEVPGQKSVVPYAQHASGKEGEPVLDAFSERKKLLSYEREASQKTMRRDACWCDACTMDPSFCYGCECSLCRAVILPKQTWSFLHCPGCNHVCHLECALKARKAGVVKEMGLDGEYMCPSCLRKRDLISFWKERVKNAMMSAETSVVEKHLFSAVLVLNGTQREMYQSIHEKLKELHSFVLYNTDCPELTKWLREIQKDVDALDDPAEKIENVEEISEELLRHFQAADLLVEENKVLEWKKKVELDHAEWLQAENLADTQRAKLQDAIEQVKKVEEEVILRAECARASKRNLQRAERRLQFLKTSCKTRVLPKEQIEEQRKVFNIELSELCRIQGKVGSLSYEPGDLSVADFSLVPDGLKIQRKRVESAQAMLEHLLALDKLFK